jgi:hypothetical protein
MLCKVAHCTVARVKLRQGLGHQDNNPGDYRPLERLDGDNVQIPSSTAGSSDVDNWVKSDVQSHVLQTCFLCSHMLLYLVCDEQYCN